MTAARGEPGRSLPPTDRVVLRILGWQLAVSEPGADAPPDMVSLAETLARAPEGDRPDRVGWPAILDRARRHGVESVVLAALDHPQAEVAELAIPIAALREARAQRMARQSALRWLIDGLRTTYSALEDAGCEPLILKGPVLGERVWAPRLGVPPAEGGLVRPSSDIDILVPPDRFGAADEALKTLGYAPAHTDSRAADVTYRSETGPLVELHRRPTAAWGLEPSTEAIFARSEVVRSEVVGREVRVMGAEQEWPYLALHALKHGAERLAWLYDLAAHPLRDAPDPATPIGVSSATDLIRRVLRRDLGVGSNGPVGGLRMQLLDASRVRPRDSFGQRIARTMLALTVVPGVAGRYRLLRGKRLRRRRE